MSTPMHSELIKVPTPRVFTTNQTADAAAAPTTSATEPSVSAVDGIIRNGGSMAKIVGFGTDAANETFSCDIHGWFESGGDTTIWYSVHLYALTFTLGTRTGVAGTDVLDTELFADTVVAGSYQATFGGDNWVGLLSPAGNGGAMALIPTVGATYLEFDVYDGTTASCNVLCGIL